MRKKELSTNDCIALLSPELKSYLYDVHQETVESTIQDGRLSPTSEQYLPPDVLSLKKHRYMILLKHGTSSFTEKDAAILNCYISSFPKAIKMREMTKTMTDVVEELTNHIMYIGLWITHEYCPDLHITVHVTSRRKDWEGEETKLLLKAVKLVYTNDDSVSSIQPPIIRDLFGIRVIIEQTEDSEVLLRVMKIIVSVLTNPSSKEYIAFYEWVRTTNKLYGGSLIPKERLLAFLDYDFSMSHEKNYVLKQKDNGYQSWQATFTVEPSSPKAGGSMFELQGRTSKMEEKAEYGGNLNTEEVQKKLAHVEYKKELYELRMEIFGIKHYSGGLLYFNPLIGYDDDGIRKSKHIASRTSSLHLVSKK